MPSSWFLVEDGCRLQGKFLVFGSWFLVDEGCRLQVAGKRVLGFRLQGGDVVLGTEDTK